MVSSVTGCPGPYGGRRGGIQIEPKPYSVTLTLYLQPMRHKWRGSSALPPRLARSPATNSSLSEARCATAAVILQKVLQILPPIVEGNFLPRLDSAQCHDHYPAPASHWFCIRPTGMINVTPHVPSLRAVDGPSLVELEHISGATGLAPVGFLGGNAPAAIGRDIDPSLDWLCREQAEPSHRTANPKGARGHRPCIATNSYDVTRA
jgi:hypothetical protein